MDDAQQNYRSQMAQYRRDLVQGDWEQSRAYDKLVVTLAGGAMVTSFAFLADQTADPAWEWVLGLGWAMLVYALAAKLYAHWTGAWAHRHAMFEVDSGDIPDNTGGTLSKVSDFLDWSSGAALVIGMACLSLFAYGNL